MTLQMLSSDQSEDLRGVKTYWNNFLPFSSEQVRVFSDHGRNECCLFMKCSAYFKCVYFIWQVHPGNEALEENFVRFVERLLEDPKEREHFIEVCLLNPPSSVLT